MDVHDLTLEELFPKWFWMLGLGLAVGCVTLLALYYVKYPDRNWFDDFTFRRSIPRDLSGLDTAPPSTDAQADQS